MRPRAFVRIVLFVLLIGFPGAALPFPAAAAGDAAGGLILATGGRYTARITLSVDEKTSVTSQSLSLSFTRGETSTRGIVHAAFVHGADGRGVWDGAVEASGPSFSAALFLRRPHRSSDDPFKLVHASARGDDGAAVFLSWKGPLAGTALYALDVPLRRRPGALAAASLFWPSASVSGHVVAYGSDRVRHTFFVIDGETMWGETPVQWGAALQRGVEAEDGPGPGLVVHRPVEEAAAFARFQWRRGAHGGWIRIHGTTDGFRSLTADGYPFSRGKIGLEGRWQWRVGPGRLFSLFARRLEPLSPDPTALPVDYEAEAGFSSMPRDDWGWRLYLEGRTKGGTPDTARLEGTVTDPARRWEASFIATWRGGEVAWRRQFAWDGGTWRLRLLVDESFGGWRAEGRSVGGTDWGWTVVYKARFEPEPGSPDPWVHAEVRRRVDGLGELWLRYMEPDGGRIDAGWRQSPAVVLGLDVAF